MKITLLLIFIIPTLLVGKWIEPPTRSAKGYLVPSPNYSPVLPQDYGSHPAYGLEWWYWVGHLQSINEEQEFGFQSTVFRLAGDPQKSNQEQNQSFGKQNLFLVHSALSDLSADKYLHNERVYREGWQAHASTQTLDLSVGGVKARLLEDGTGHRVTTQLTDGGMLDLTFRPTKPLIAFGDRGLSRKGSDPSSVSWYWSYTRLKVEGVLVQNKKETKLKGIAWMDHEISSSQLGEGLAGWDWTCMQLDDGTEVKAYRLRQEDGGSDPWSAVYWIDQVGKVEKVYSSRFSWSTEKKWVSPKTGLEYPSSIKVTAQHPTKGEQTYRLRPLLEDQEFSGNRSDNAYWEGACEVLDLQDNRIGLAYLELAGYGGGLGARLN